MLNIVTVPTWTECKRWDEIWPKRLEVASIKQTFDPESSTSDLGFRSHIPRVDVLFHIKGYSSTDLNTMWLKPTHSSKIIRKRIFRQIQKHELWVDIGLAEEMVWL